VAARAEELTDAVPPADRPLLVAAAWWHDIGYAPCLSVLGFHPLDGAAFMRAQGYCDRLAALIAHHSGAEYEAEERGLVEQMRQWPREQSAVADALWTADMTIGPDGASVDYATRLAEILARRGADSIVGRARVRARDEVARAIARTEARRRRGVRLPGIQRSPVSQRQAVDQSEQRS
jgi:hypothetical protein